MSQNKIRHLMVIAGGFFLFLADRFLKNLSLNFFTSPKLLLPIIGWQPYQNPGIAFNLPFPNTLTILLTLPILIILPIIIYHFYKKPNSLNLFTGLVAIFLGALSNFIDRLFFKATIDYWLFGTGLINLADLLIICGFIIILLPNKFFKN
jgi:lipoprotein signal peptidase